MLWCDKAGKHSLKGSWRKYDPKRGALTLLKLKQSKQGYPHAIFHHIKAINFWPRLLRNLSQGRGSQQKREDRGCQNFLSTDLKLPARGSWTETHGQCLTKRETHWGHVFPSPGNYASPPQAWLWFSWEHSILTLLRLDQFDSPNLRNCALTVTSLLTFKAMSSTFPGPDWFPKSFMEGTNSGSGSLATQMSNTTKKKSIYTNCVHSCGLEDSYVKISLI